MTLSCRLHGAIPHHRRRSPFVPETSGAKRFATRRIIFAQRQRSEKRRIASNETFRFDEVSLAKRLAEPSEIILPGASPKYHARHKLLTLQLDMADWFRPTWANYSSRIGKADILAALREAKGATAPACEKGQKGRPRRSRGAAYRRNGLAARAPARSRSRARDGFEGSDLKTPVNGSPAPPAAPPCRPV